jgi:RNA polymerase sigma factor (sigma-70 family)
VPESEPDLELVQQCLAGHPAAMRAMVERFQGDVFGLCVRMLTDRHDAEDATQEIFLRIFRSLRKWDRTRPLKPWITAITVNRCRTWIARRGAKPRPTALPDDVSERRPETDDGRELAEAVRVAVDSMRDDHKAVFVLFHEHGQNYEEIADAIGRPVGTIKTWLHRARATVLDHLKRVGLVADSSVSSVDETT